MELLQGIVRSPLTEALYEELCVEDVLTRRACHHSGSGDAIRIPRIERVPSMSLRWNTTRSSARSIVSVAVAAPRARFAALSLASGRRYVRGTRRSRDAMRLRLVVVGMFSVYLQQDT